MMRKEIKYRCESSDRLESMFFLKEFGFKQAFPPRQVTSIYYDGLALQSYWDNIEGYSERKKYRIRWYDNFESGKTCQLQQKWKSNGFGSKQIVKFNGPSSKGQLFENLLTVVEESEITRNELTEIFCGDHICNWVNLFPAVEVGYVREYYQSQKLECRVTIDKEIRTVAIDHRLKARQSEVEFDVIIVEIKFRADRREVIDRYTNRVGKPSEKFSKYAESIAALSGSFL
jgi:SPX domain protein involved in polyphosphate accumulation